MAFTLEYRNGGFYVNHSGMISSEEIEDANGRIHGSEAFDDHRFQVINVLEADFSDMAAYHAKATGATDSIASRSNRDVRVAVVCVEPTAVAFCREYIKSAARHGSSWAFRLFEDADAAEAWASSAPE